jgi:hypothetical protein
MLLFRKDKTKEIEVQRLLTKIINVHSRSLDALREGPRGELRVDLAMVVIVVPSIDGRPDRQQAFATVTREVSSTGMSLVLSERLEGREVFLVIDVQKEMRYVRGEIRHQGPLGAGLYQAGVKLTELLTIGDYPEMAPLKI